jgi:hypothetical protein
LNEILNKLNVQALWKENLYIASLLLFSKLILS